MFRILIEGKLISPDITRTEKKKKVKNCSH